MERERPEQDDAPRDRSPPQPGERSGCGTDELYRLISADEVRSAKDDGDPAPLANPLSESDSRRLASIDANQALNDWLQTHRELMRLEAAFTDLAIQAAMGDVPPEELAQQRAVLEGTRELCSAAYRRAFPNAR